MPLAELLLIELVLNMSHAVTFFNFLHETQVVLTESFDYRVESSLAVAARAFFMSRGKSWDEKVVFLGHADGK